MKKKYIPYFVIVVLIAYIILIGESKTKVVTIPSQENEKEIKNPIPEIRLDTIYVDSIKKEIILKVIEVENPVNAELMLKYEEAVKQNDSLIQLELYRNAIKERLYTETLEDSVQTITVKSEVIGFLKYQVINYKTKPRIINLDLPKKKLSIYAGGFLYDMIEEPAMGVNLSLMNGGKNRLYTIGFDSRNRVHFGVTYKLF